MINRIKDKILFLVPILLILYFTTNLLSGNRGLFSYIEKKNTIRNLQTQISIINKEIRHLEKTNSLLSDNLDKDYIEILLRDKYLLGKKGETIYILNNE